MNRLKNLLLVLAISVSSFVMAQNPPPPQLLPDTSGPGLPIDDNILVLVTAALIFGIYIAVRKFKKA